MTMANTALAEIKEADATGVIADIYNDIRNSLRVPMVNLIFRHMATVPGCLEWAWVSVGPLYVSGRVAEAAQALLAKQQPLALNFSSDEITACDMSAETLAAVRATCRAYSSANPANLLALKALRLMLDETPQARAQRKPTPGALTRPPIANVTALPPMAEMAALADDTKALLRALAHQLHGPDGRVIPSFYRHFTAWPQFLQLLLRQLQLIIDNGTLGTAAAAMDHQANHQASALYLDCPVVPLAAPSEAAAATLKELIDLFPPNICKMTLIAQAIARSMAQ